MSRLEQLLSDLSGEHDGVEKAHLADHIGLTWSTDEHGQILPCAFTDEHIVAFAATLPEEKLDEILEEFEDCPCMKMNREDFDADHEDDELDRPSN